MAKYPIKMLLDELKRPFFPLVTIDTIVTNNSDKTLKELFEDRYTKAEVDKIISDLGTLQRLRGTINSYEELLAIENPMPGDTYILLGESGNNSEYMYIGDRWELLGPMASYTDVYSKEVMNEILSTLKQELNTKIEHDDAETLAQAKLHAESLFANIPEPNLDEYYKKNETDAKIAEEINAIEFPDAGEVLPIGTMLPYASTNNIPTNWRICDGSEVSRTDYAELFNIIGTAYGEGDGETTFNLPDKRGRVSVGLDLNQNGFNNVGLKAGEKTHTLTANEMPSHLHNQSTIGNDGAANPWVTSANSGQWGVESRNQYAYRAGTGTYLNTYPTGGNQAHNNLQPYEVDVWIIKVTNDTGVLEIRNADVIDNLTSTSSTDALSANMGKVLNNKIENISNYSTDEVIVGTCNGKPLYRKSFNFVTSSTNFTADLSSLNIDKAFIDFSHSNFDQGEFILPLGIYGSSTDWNRPFYNKDTKTLYIQFGSVYTMSKDIWITIEYTKTTD